MKTLTLIFLVSSAALEAEEVLLFEDFDKEGPLENEVTWLAHEKTPHCTNSEVLTVPRSAIGFQSRKTFKWPISVRFERVWMTQADTPSDNNNIGITSGYSPNMICFRFAKGNLYAVRRFKGAVYDEPNKVAKGEWGTFLGKIQNREKGKKASVAYDLRIDWWPGKLVRFYLDGKKVCEYFDHVSAEPSPIGVRDESAYFRIGSIRVVRPSEDIGKILDERKNAEMRARKAKEEAIRAKKRKETNRVRARIDRLKKKFGKFRMVIGGPCYFWGIDNVIQDELKEAGMEVLAWPDAPLLDPELTHEIKTDLKLYNVIIFGGGFYHLIQPDPNTGAIPERICKQVPLLRKFLKAGGSIFFSGIGEQNWGRSSHVLNYILKELNLGAEVLGEVVKDSEAINTGGQLFPFYAWAEVLRDPLTDGVRNILHPSGVVEGEGSMGVCPILKLDPEWRVLLKGKETAASYPVEEGVQEGRLVKTPGKIKSSPMLCAVRQAGKGRVALWPTWSVFTVTGGSGGMLLDGENNGRRSDGALLLENLLCWLAEPGQKSNEVGIFDLANFKVTTKKLDIDGTLQKWRKPGRKDFTQQYKGIIGAHSSLSDGQSSPDEMIAAARKAGYDFIAFTEDLSRLNQDEWKRLLQACDKASQSGDGFQAWPGIDFKDEAGNRGLHFGQRYWIRDSWRSKEDPNRIRWWYNFTYDVDADAHRWAPRVVFRSKTNAKRPWLQGLWNLFGAYSYEGGKLVDDSFHEWRTLIGPHVFFLNTGIVSVHTVRSAAEIGTSASNDLFQTYVRANKPEQVLSHISGSSGTGFMGCFPTYISQGPIIEEFRCFAAVMGGEVSFDLAVPGNDRGYLHLLTRSDAGLKQIAVFDGERLLRRIRPDGKKSFEAFINILGDSVHGYSMTVTDMNGRKAHSMNAFLQIQEWVHRRCGDNWNWMRTGKGPGSFETPEFPFHLHEVTGGWRTRTKKPAKKPVPKNASCEQGQYSHGGLSGVINGYLHPENVLVDGKPWIKFVYPVPAWSLSFETVGRFGTVLTSSARSEQIIPKLEPYTIGAFSGPYKVVPSPWPADIRQFVPMMKPGGMSANRVQGQLWFKNQITARHGKKTLSIRLGGTGNPGAETVEVVQPDGTAKRFEGSGIPLVGEIPVGGYVCWHHDNGAQAGGILALSPGVHYSYSTGYQSCTVEVPSPANPGTEVGWDVIYMTGTRQQMEDLRVGMGIAGRPALYEVQPQFGKVIDQKYFLTLEAADGGFSGKVARTTNRSLPVHLPVFVQGLNPRWAAALWYRGKARLHKVDYYRDPFGIQTWRWSIATYAPHEDEIRPIPILEGGIGYCQVDTDKQAADVFIGNPIICDDPRVFITMFKAERGKCTFEINNPTEEEIKCTVQPAEGFELTETWQMKMVLRSGTMKTITRE